MTTQGRSRDLVETRKTTFDCQKWHSWKCSNRFSQLSAEEVRRNSWSTAIGRNRKQDAGDHIIPRRTKALRQRGFKGGRVDGHNALFGQTCTKYRSHYSELYEVPNRGLVIHMSMQILPRVRFVRHYEPNRDGHFASKGPCLTRSCRQTRLVNDSQARPTP